MSYAVFCTFDLKNATAQDYKIRDDIRQRIQNAFKARSFNSEIFVLVGGEEWTWGTITT
jgi:hypothetical protein